MLLTLIMYKSVLVHMVHRDAIREADGFALVHQTRMHMLFFWAKNRNKYLICQHRFLAGNKLMYFVAMSEVVVDM